MSLKTLLRDVCFILITSTLITAFLASFTHAEAGAPRRLALGASQATSRSLGTVCYVSDSGEEALPCNPAFIARETNPDFNAQLLAGHNISYLQDVSTLVDGGGDEGTVRRLFSQTRASEMEASIEGGYRRPTFGVAVTPVRWVYYSWIRNRSLPVVTLLAAQEQSLKFQFGGYFGNDWSWGVQLQAIRRKFISRTFTLADAFAENGKEIFDPETQSAFLIEPGLIKENPDQEWEPTYSISVMKWGAVDRKVEDFPASPELHLGAAARPPVGLGAWDIGLDANLNSELKHWDDPWLRLGTGYKIGMTRLMASASASDYSTGFTLRYRDLTGGLTYNSNYLENNLGESEWVRTVYFHFGVDL